MAAMTMISIRVPSKLVARFDAAAAESGCRNRSAWARQVLVEAVKGNGKAHDSLPVQSHGGATRATTGACLHPLPARVKLPLREDCGVCGARVK